MYRLSVTGNTGGVNDNALEYQMLEQAPGVNLKEKVNALNMMQSIKDILGTGAMNYLNTYGPDQGFLYFLTLGDSLEQIGVYPGVLNERDARLLFLIHAMFDYAIRHNLMVCNRDGEALKVADYQNYVREHGYDVSYANELLRSLDDETDLDGDSKPEEASDGVWEDAQSHQNDPVEGLAIEMKLDSSFWKGFKAGNEVLFSVPMKEVTGFVDEINDQLSFMDLRSVTSHNGNINRKRALKLLEKRAKKGRVRVNKAYWDGSQPIFAKRVGLDVDRAVGISIFGQTHMVNVRAAGVLNRKSLNRGMSEANLSSVYNEELINDGTMGMVSMLRSIGMEQRRFAGAPFGVPNPSDKIDLKSDGFVENGKLIVYDRQGIGEVDDPEENWEKLGSRWILFPRQDYVLAEIFHRYLVFMES